MATILIVDDDAAFRESLAETVAGFGHTVEEAASGQAALDRLQDRSIDLIMMDVRMPGLNGLEVLQRVRSDPRSAHVPVIILTAFAASHNTIEAMKLGAFDHLTKPVGRDDVRDVLARVLARPAAEALRAARSGVEESGLMGASRAMREVQKLIGLAAAGDVSTLISGETGTGKELVARALHGHSARAPHPFIAVNCAAIPSELLESELFGHVKGAFTGALTDHAGRFREADRGTLFLDEIGDMPLPMQVKLLRVLQDREVQPLGSSRRQRVDIRLVAATNKDLLDLVKESRFREDLFYRLKVFHIHLPPLRERGSDILLLAEHFLYQASPDAPKQLTAAAAQSLLEYEWPGNVRELENLMRNLTVLVRGSFIDKSDLPLLKNEPAAALSLDGLTQMPLPAAMKRLERHLIQHALHAAHGNRTEAARRLGIHRQLLYAKLKEYGL
jgi:two-component system NtrC family response regulator